MKRRKPVCRHGEGFGWAFVIIWLWHLWHSALESPPVQRLRRFCIIGVWVPELSNTLCQTAHGVPFCCASQRIAHVSVAATTPTEPSHSGGHVENFWQSPANLAILGLP